MFRSIVIPVILGVLALFSFISSQVTLDVVMPESAKAGDEFVVEITINKGDIEGFARFQQELPVGFTAVPRQSANGEFKFEDQKVKIQWMQVPSDRSVVISYAIQVGPTVSGTFPFEGKFSYIENNSVQTVSAAPSNAPKSIVIIADELAAGTAEQAQTTYSYQNVSLKNIDCVRQKPFLNENNEVIVNLMVNKGDLKEFGKIQEQIPRGYRAESIKSKNSIFTFKNSIIKFLWMNMPPEAQFVVSYKLIPEGEISNQAFLITGTFSYAENERTKTLNIGERAVDLSTFAGEDLVAQTVTPANNTQNTQSTEVNTQEVQTANTQQANTNQSNTSNQSTELASTNNTNNTTANPNMYDVEQKAKQQDAETARTMNNLAAITNIPLPDNGVSYRVQIAAGHKLVGKNYFKRLNITDDVQVEMHDGWNKYTVGNFGIYRDAHDYRIYVWNNTPIQDAFVAAYNSGMRITVQEALMIANQKWYE